MTVIDPTNVKSHQIHNTTVRPSIYDLQNDEFMAQLTKESDKITRESSFAYSKTSSSSLPFKTGETSKSKARKSRFALEREAEIEAARQHAGSDIPPLSQQVPTGRFQLDLSDYEDFPTTTVSGHDVDQFEKKDSTQSFRNPLLGEIVERDDLKEPNEDFESKFEPSGFPSVESSEHFSMKCKLTSPTTEKPSSPQATFDFPIPSCSSKTIPSSSEFSLETKKSIATENQSTLANMSEAEILAAQAEIKDMLMKSNPVLLEQLLKKNNVSTSQSSQLDCKNENILDNSPDIQSHQKPNKRVQFSDEILVSPYEDSTPTNSGQECARVFSPGVATEKHGPSKPSSEPACSHQAIHKLPKSQFNFDIKGQMMTGLFGDDAVNPATNQSLCDAIHPQRAESFTLQQLFGFIMSSVPSQRVMGFKIMTRITDRYLANQHLNESHKEFAVFEETELQPAIPDMILASSHALGEKNVGLADSALMLFYSVSCGLLSRKRHNPKSLPASKLEWIEELFTQVDVLAKIQSHFRYQVLSKFSLIVMVKLLNTIIQLGEQARVSEEITKRFMLLEDIIQVLVSVPWPPVTSAKFEVPSLECLHLLDTLSLSSRQCSQSLVDRGLLTPTFRFLALPYWSLDSFAQAAIPEAALSPDPDSTLLMANFITQQFTVISTFSEYGLGTSLRTTLDPLLRPITLGLQKRLSVAIDLTNTNVGGPDDRIVGELELISAYLNLLRNWMRCANDPHVIVPPHSINWSQVVEWSTDSIEFIEICLHERHSVDVPPIARSRYITNDVLATACDLLVEYLTGSLKKNGQITETLTHLSRLELRLKDRLQRSITHFLSMSNDANHITPKTRCNGDARLITSMARLSALIHTHHKELRHGLSSWHDDVSWYPNENEFALACRLAANTDNLSTVPSSFCLLYKQLENRMPDWMCVASLLLRNSDGDMILSAITTTLDHFQNAINASDLGGSNDLLSAVGREEQCLAPDIELLRPLYEAYVNECALSTKVSYPTPRQTQLLMKQCDQPAFVLASTWPSLALNFLTQTYLKSLIIDVQPTQISMLNRLARATFALAVFVRSALCRIQTQYSALSSILNPMIGDDLSVWKITLTTLIVLNSQNGWDLGTESSSDHNAQSIFDDEIACRLIMKFISPFQSKSRRSDHLNLLADRKPDRAEAKKLTKDDEMELYSIFTDILGIYDSSSFANPIFSILLIPFCDMRHSIDFRRLLFKDYLHILTHLQVDFDEVIILDDDSLDFRSYLYPIETDEDMITVFTQLLSERSPIKRETHPFLYLYLVHHVSSLIWCSTVTFNRNARLPPRLLTMILSQCTDQGICDVLGYSQTSSHVETAPDKLIQPPSCYESVDECHVAQRIIFIEETQSPTCIKRGLMSFQQLKLRLNISSAS
ncbi:hypothetical protein DFH28DRAFT_968524 [Melampsora americana]|nr:hypothetical protein DFH28DRAFT_968524 [Melampsora americana]